MFDYYKRKQVAQQQSRKVIEKYADEYAKLTHKLNFTDAGLKELENELKAKCQDELMGIRKNFKNEAEPGLSNNKLEYAQAKKDKYSKLTAQEKQTMLIEQQLRIQELEAQLEIYGAGGMLETLKELSTQDEQLFNIVKGKCMSKADANTKNIISGMNYIDLVEQCKLRDKVETLKDETDAKKFNELKELATNLIKGRVEVKNYE